MKCIVSVLLGHLQELLRVVHGSVVQAIGHVGKSSCWWWWCLGILCPAAGSLSIVEPFATIRSRKGIADRCHFDLDALPTTLHASPVAMNLFTPWLSIDSRALLSAYWLLWWSMLCHWNTSGSQNDVSIEPPAGIEPREIAIHFRLELATLLATLSKLWVAWRRIWMRYPTAANLIRYASFLLGCHVVTSAVVVALRGASALSWGLPGIYPPAAGIFASLRVMIKVARLWLTCDASGTRQDEEKGHLSHLS